MNDVYENPLITRYASQEMSRLWGTRRKIRLWRELWLALAETQAELGLLADDGRRPRISPTQLQELRNHLDDIDFAHAADYERKLRHDVMAHVHAYGDAAPGARDIIHLGATSCFVTDNADLILMRQSLEEICRALASLIDSLASFAEKWRSEPTLGFTHFQPAQLTTVGKRATLWAYDFVLDLKECERRLRELPFRGAKGTTGTQASFLKLFNGNHEKVRELDRRLALKFGFEQSVPVCGQTYTRKIDTQVLESLAGIAASAHKFGCDLRLLAHRQEIDEPFEAEQVGSSAMAYKRNPMRSERMCSLARYLIGLPGIAAQTHANQWFERTLDDSAARRIYIPQAFLAADAVLRLARNIVGGLVVNRPIIARGVREHLPYMATENLLMAAVAAGADRQAAHEVIRRHSQAVTERIKQDQGHAAELLERLKAESIFGSLDFSALTQPANFIGRAPEQVDEFLQQEIAPIRSRYRDLPAQTQTIHV